MKYSDKLKDPRWQKKRLSILNRDKFTCQGCSIKDKTLHVHHFNYTENDPWDEADYNLITLCKDCHKIAHELDILCNKYGSESVLPLAERLNIFSFWSIAQSFITEGKESPFKRIRYPFFK